MQEMNAVSEAREGASSATHSDEPRVSIRAHGEGTACLCAVCKASFLAAGPTGYLGDEPICDLCMLDHDHELGMVLVLLAVTRAYGSDWPTDKRTEDSARLELMAFARLYNTHASRSAPARPIPHMPEMV